MRTSLRWMLLLGAAGLWGCSSSSTTDSGTPPDSGGPADAGGGTDAGGNVDSGTPDSGAMDSGTADSGTPDSGSSDAGQDLAPCTAADYVTTPTTITFPGNGTFAYTPKCLTVTVNSMVTFSGAFTNHPLTPSTRGTQPSPIMLTNTGTTQTFTFSAPGFYPYYCGFHGADDGLGGLGMAGVIQVQ